MPRASRARAIPPKVTTPPRWIVATALRIAALASLRLAEREARAAAIVSAATGLPRFFGDIIRV
jgi:hypothetical protein